MTEEEAKAPPPKEPGGPGRSGKPGSLTDQTIKGFAWQFLGTGVELVVRVVVMILLARLLAPGEFGVVAAALIVVNFTQILAQLGVGQSIVQLRELSDDHIRSGFAFSCWAGLASAAIVFAVAPLLAMVFNIPAVRPVIQALSICFVLTGPVIVAQGLLLRQRRYKEIAGLDAASFTLGYGLLGVGFAWLGFGAWSLVIAQVAQSALRMALVLRLQQHPRALTFKTDTLWQLLSGGVGFSIGQIGNFVATNADNFAVGRWLGADALGLYSRAYQFLMIPANLFGTVVDKVLFPAMAHVQHDPVRLVRAFRRSLAVVAMITLPLSGALVILAPELVHVVLGPKWAGMIPPFQVLAATLLFRTSYKMSDSLARATGANYRRAWRQWVYAGAVFLGARLGSRWGLWGVALGVSFAIILNFVLMLQLAVQITRISWWSVVLLHARFVAAALPVLIFVAGAAWWARSMGYAPVVTLLAGGVAGAVGGAATTLIGRPVYGEDGVWILDVVAERLAPLLKRLKRS